MATERLPAYVQVHKLAGGKRAYYWVRPKWAAPPAERHGRACPIVSTALGDDLALAIQRATALNAAFKEWREGERATMAPGSVQWLFDWFRGLEAYTGLRHNTRKGYRTAMGMVEAVEMKVGVFRTRQARAVDAAAVDPLYKKARAKHGERQGSYMMQVCRLVWNQAVRHKKVTGVTENPFAKMRIRASSGAGRGNRAATRAEYDAYREAARELGKQSMAAAAAICFEGCQRVYDAFGFVDPDGRISRGVRWEGYEPGRSLTLIQSKTGNPVALPLTDVIDGEEVALYPELEAELARVERLAEGGLIVRDERTGEPYTTSYMTKLHRRIRDHAKLPADLKFTSFRHGGITEVGDSGTDDMRPVSGHTKLDTTRIYNKANAEKARRIAAKRREHIAAITAGAVDEDEREAA